MRPPTTTRSHVLVAAALATIFAVAGCGTDTNDDATKAGDSGTTASSRFVYDDPATGVDLDRLGRQLSDQDIGAALPTFDDLPSPEELWGEEAGDLTREDLWRHDPVGASPENDAVTEPPACADVVNTVHPDPKLHSYGNQSFRTITFDVLGATIASHVDLVGSDASADLVAALEVCSSFSGTVSGNEQGYAVSPAPFPNLGDDTVSYHIEIQGDLGGEDAALSGQVVQIRVGHNVIRLHSIGLTVGEGDHLERIARTVVERLEG